MRSAVVPGARPNWGRPLRRALFLGASPATGHGSERPLLNCMYSEYLADGILGPALEAIPSYHLTMKRAGSGCLGIEHKMQTRILNKFSAVWPEIVPVRDLAW